MNRPRKLKDANIFVNGFCNGDFSSGLDDVAVKQCISLLHNLTRQGRTIICTIHQPPASAFNMFDQVE